MPYKKVNPTFIVLGEDHPIAEGTIVSFETVPIQGRDVTRVTLDTESGPIAFLAGAQLEGMLGGVVVGSKILIEHTGEAKVKNGTMKTFDLHLWEE